MRKGLRFRTPVLGNGNMADLRRGNRVAKSGKLQGADAKPAVGTGPPITGCGLLPAVAGSPVDTEASIVLTGARLCIGPGCRDRDDPRWRQRHGSNFERGECRAVRQWAAFRITGACDRSSQIPWNVRSLARSNVGKDACPPAGAPALHRYVTLRTNDHLLDYAGHT